jgi:uncharacterized DUF497 family protein
MEFEWDEQKRLSNLAKHGLDFADAERFDWSTVTGVADKRFEYGEERFRAFEMLDGRLVVLAFTFRGSVLRIFSFRPANRQERRSYGPKE